MKAAGPTGERATSVAPGGTAKTSQWNQSHGPGRDERGVVRLNVGPPDLAARGPAHGRAQRRGQGLAPEAQAEHGDVVGHRAAQQLDLLVDPRRAAAGRGVPRAQRGDEGPPADVRRERVAVGAVHDVGQAARAQPALEQVGRPGRAVLEHEPGAAGRPSLP